MSLTTQAADPEMLQTGVTATLAILRDRVAEFCSTTRAAFLQPILARLEQLRGTPASTRHSHHGAFDGGLIMHIGDVLNFMLITSNAIGSHMGIVSGTRSELLKLSMPEKEFDDRAQGMQEITQEAIVTTALLHDLNKLMDFMGNPHYAPNILKSGKRSDASPYEVPENYEVWGIFRGRQGIASIADILLSGNGPQISSGLVSLAIANDISPGLYADLTPAERQAIIFHAGLYEKCDKTGFMGSEHPLSILIHFADMMASRTGF